MEKLPVKTLECKHCSKFFLTKSGLKRHMSGHLTVKPFKCQMCGTGFCHKSSFKRHVLKNSCTPVDLSKPQTHKLVEKLSRSQYSCHVCGVGFAHKYTFKTHMIMNSCRVLETEQNSLSESSSIESASLVESWAVDIRNVAKKRTKSTDSRINEKFTEKVSSRDSQETCIVCRKVFPSKSDLEAHVKEHFKKKPSKSSSVAEIKTSVTGNTDNNRPQNSQTVFSCQLCGKITESFIELNAHIEHCDGFLKNKCSICEKSFTKQSLLRRHMKKHGASVREGRVDKGKKLPKSVEYIESEPSSSELISATNLHRGNQDVSLRKKKKLSGKTASVEEETPNDYEEMTVYITEEQMDDRDIFSEGERLDKIDHIGHIAEDPLIDHYTDDMGNSSDNNFLGIFQKTEEEKIVQSSSAVQSVVRKVHDKFMEPVPDILSGNQKSACPSGNLCSETNISASRSEDNGCSDAHNVSHSQAVNRSGHRAQSNTDGSDLGSTLSLPAQSDNSGIVSTTVTNEINLSDSSSCIQAQIKSSVAEIMCQENTSNELSVKRKEITTVYIEEGLDDEIELFEESNRSTVERSSTSADPLTRDLLATEKHVFSEEELKSDLAEHPVEHKYSCDVCQMTFNRKDTFHQHMAEHEEKQKFKCSVCWGDFWFESELAEHMKTHEKSQQYTCNFCGLNFVKKCGLVGHLKTHLDVQSFSCDLCDRTFATKTPFIKHRRLHKARKRKAGIVNLEQETSRVSNLVPNEREANTNDELNSFTYVLSMETSESKVPDEQVAGKYKCNLCERTFHGKGSLKRHLKIHDRIGVCGNDNDIKACSFDCDVCHKKFRKKNHLARHYSIHKSYMLSCSICNLAVKSKHALTFHYKKHFSEDMLDSDMANKVDLQHFGVVNEYNPNCSSLEASVESNKEVLSEKDIDIAVGQSPSAKTDDTVPAKTDDSIPEKIDDTLPSKTNDIVHAKIDDIVPAENDDTVPEKIDDNIPAKTDDIRGGTMGNKKASLPLEQQGNLVISSDQQEEKMASIGQKGENILLDIQQETTSLLCDKKEAENIPVFGAQQEKKVEDKVPEQDGDKRQTENEVNKKKFVCPTCGRAFTKKSCLSMHSHIHRGHRPFACPMCPLTFITDKSLHVHLYQHKKKYSTDAVPGAFKGDSPKKGITILSPPAINASVIDSPTDFEVASDGDERKHLRECRLSGRTLQDSEEEMLACFYCNKKCLTKSALANHLKTHTEYDHFPCKLCGITFYFEDTLSVHQKKYHSFGQTEVSHGISTLTDDKEKHISHGELQFKESDISNNLNAADKDSELNSKSETSNLTLGNSGNEIQGTASNSKVTYRESFHGKNMSDVCKDNLNSFPTCANLVEGQSGIVNREKEAKDSKKKLNYVCSICGKAFLYHRLYMRHKVVCFKKKNTYACKSSGCDRMFSRRYNLNRHMKVHFKSKLSLFGKKTNVKRNLYGGLNRRSNFGLKASLDNPDSVVGEENCNLCGMNLKKSDLHNHLKEYHSVMSTPDTYEFREELDDVEKGQIALKEFRIKNQEDQTLSGPMEVEPMQKYGSAVTATKEPEQFNIEGQYNHISPTASYEKKTVGKLSVDGSEGDNFKWRNNERDKNTKVFTNRVAYHCKICNINLFRQLSYTKHMKLHDDIQDLKCSICGEVFYNESELSMHKDRHKSELLMDDETKHNRDKKNDGGKSSSSLLLNKDSQSSAVLSMPVSDCPSDVKTISEKMSEEEAFKQTEPESKKIRLQDCEYDCTVCGRLIMHAVDFVMHLSFHKDRDELMRSHYGPSDQLYDVIQLIFKTPICNVCRKVFCICKALGLGEDEDMNMYNCDVCEMKFMVKWSLANHMSQHGDTVNASLIIKDMKAHLMKTLGKLSSTEAICFENKQMEEGRFQCSICGKTTENASCYNLHLKTHERTYSFKCSYCQKSFKKKVARDNHMRTHKKPGEAHVPKVSSGPKEKQNIENILTRKSSDDVSNSEGRHKDSLEGKSSKSDLIDSRKVADDGGETCNAVTVYGEVNEEPSKSGKDIDHIEVSDSIVDGTKEKDIMEENKNIDANSVKDNITSNNEDETTKGSYVCPVCNESFTRYQKLLSHEKVHFEPVMYDCEKCKNFFQCKEDYDEHLKTHAHKNSLKYYGCPVCGKKMANHANFLRHYASHSPMHDGQIGLNEKDTNALQNTLFLNSVASVDGDDTFSSFGNRYEKVKSDMQSSVTSVGMKLGIENESDDKLLEGKNSNSTEERSFQCRFCNLSFGSQLDFQKHNLIHEFTCWFCGHTFSRKSKFKMHQKRHSAKDKQCKHCWRRFLRNREFELHKITHKTARKGDSLAGDSREVANISSDEADSLSKVVDKSELEINENRGKVLRKEYRKDSQYLEDGESGCDNFKILDSEQNPLNSQDPRVTHEVRENEQQYLNKKLPKCNVCEMSFQSYRKYREHRKVHLKVQSINCDICKESFDIRSYLKHMDDHQFMPPYSCFHCGEKFSDHELFACHCKEHDMVNDNERPAALDASCAGSSANETEKLDSLGLSSNSVTMSNSRHLSNTCEICQRKCESCYFFNMHMEEHYKNKPIRCDICKKTIINKGRFKKHLKTHLLKSFICNVCDRSFKHQHILLSHFENMHNWKIESAELVVEEVEDKEKLNDTEIRDKNVSGIVKVPSINDMLPGVTETFKCRLCSKLFSHKYKLVTHLRKSHKLDLEQAKQLAAEAAEAQVEEIMDVTITGKDEQRDVIVYESEMELKTRDISVSKKEKKKRTGDDVVPGISESAIDKVPTSGKKCLVCPLCGKVCSCRSNLNDHVISHSNDKPWRCPDCKIKFKRLWDRNRHIRKKHGCDPKTLLATFGGNVRGFDSSSTLYDCTICDKRFLYDSVLKMHMMFHKGESSLDYIACEEEEVYECAVERNEDDGLAGLERESSSGEERVFVADYIDRDYNTEDVAIEIKEEVIDIDDVEDIIVEEFDVFSDLVLEHERDALEHLPLPSVAEELAEIHTRSEDEFIEALNDERKKKNSRKDNSSNIATNKNSESWSSEEVSSVVGKSSSESLSAEEISKVVEQSSKTLNAEETTYFVEENSFDSLSAEEISRVVDQSSKTLSAEEATNVVDKSSSESFSAEEISNIADKRQELGIHKGDAMTQDLIENVDITSSGSNSCENSLDVNTEVNITKDQLKCLNQDELFSATKGIESENSDSLQADRDAKLHGAITKDIPGELEFSELSREVQMLIDTRVKKRNTFVSRKNVYCSLCDLHFSTQRQLFGHIHVHSGCVFYQCDVCGETLKNSKQYKDHALSHILDYFDCNDEMYYVVKREPGKAAKFSCSICEKSFGSRHQLTGHLHVHSRETIRSCEACGETFKSNKLALNHLYEHLTLLFKGPTVPQARQVKEVKRINIRKLPSINELDNSYHCIGGKESIGKQDNCGSVTVNIISDKPKSCHEEKIERNRPQFSLIEKKITSEEVAVTSSRSESCYNNIGIACVEPGAIPSKVTSTTDRSEVCLDEFQVTNNKPDFSKDANVINMPSGSLHKDLKITSDTAQEFRTEMKNASDPLAFCPVEDTLNNDKSMFSLIEAEISCEPELTPPELEVKPCEPQFSPPEPEVKSCEQEFTSPKPAIKPSEQEFTSPESEVEPCEPQFSPTEPVVKPSELEFTPPESEVKPCEQEFTPPGPEVIPSEPEFTPPDPEVKPCEQEFTPPELEAKTCEQEFTPLEPAVKPCEPESTPPEPEAKPCEEEFTPPEPEAKPCEPEFTPPRPEVIPSEPEFTSPEPAVEPCEPEFTQSEPAFLSSVELSESSVGKNENDSSKEANKRDPDFKPYSCMYCSKLFQKKGSMRLHMRLHTGDRILECDVCSKKFGKKSRLKKHMQLHSKSLSS
ncbi:uncharacterized protein [Palaemon carinicauda]|uniref:uncharacterized protein isoform X1 n=1 Tax=Palaemon carinicauda TaxID=392227 RepID=UPI0035B6A214